MAKLTERTDAHTSPLSAPPVSTKDNLLQTQKVLLISISDLSAAQESSTHPAASQTSSQHQTISPQQPRRSSASTTSHSRLTTSPQATKSEPTEAFSTSLGGESQMYPPTALSSTTTSVENFTRDLEQVLRLRSGALS